jgi:hypothetical protein
MPVIVQSKGVHWIGPIAERMNIIIVGAGFAGACAATPRPTWCPRHVVRTVRGPGWDVPHALYQRVSPTSMGRE